MSGPLTPFEPTLIDDMADRLMADGWAVLQNAVPTPMVRALRQRVQALDETDKLTPAGVGRGDDFILDPTIRGDLTRWLSRGDAAEAAYLDAMDGLRLALNHRLFLGLFSFEAHFAVYPPGSFYARHVDSFRGAANRVLLVVTYLNESWHQEDGGLLIIYDEDGNEKAAIIPAEGAIAVFLSEETPHQVTVTHRLRQSIAGWFRVRGD